MIRIVPASVGELLRLGVSNRLLCFEVELSRPSFGDELCTLEEANDIAVTLNGERDVERRRSPQRDLDDIRIDEFRDDTARVPAVRGRLRPAKALRNDESSHSTSSNAEA